MSYPLFPSASPEINIILAGNLPMFIASYKNDFQTGVVGVDFHNHSCYHLLFARGELVNVYRHAENMEQIDPASWLQSINESREKSHLSAIALTPQAIRLVKILLEQTEASSAPLPEKRTLEEQFHDWRKHPAPALAHVRWPSAEALSLLPGDGSPPHYTLFISANQILHSVGGMMALYGWKEPCQTVNLLSSEARTPAWDEYLLHHSFSWMFSHLLEHFAGASGPALVGNIIREINFAAAAHGWSINIIGTNVTDQMIFSSPSDAAAVYSRLLKILFRHIETILGADSLAGWMRESISQLPRTSRSALQGYIFAAELGMVNSCEGGTLLPAKHLILRQAE